MDLNPTDKLWPVLRRVMGGHTALYRLSGGRVGHRFPGAPPTLLLDHVGAKSGTARTSPLAYFEEGKDIVIVASKGGYPKNPAWFYNLKAHPDTTIQIGAEKRPVHARVATDAEHDKIWPTITSSYKNFADYQERTDRKIPLVILQPRKEPGV